MGGRALTGARRWRIETLPALALTVILGTMDSGAGTEDRTPRFVSRRWVAVLPLAAYVGSSLHNVHESLTTGPVTAAPTVRLVEYTVAACIVLGAAAQAVLADPRHSDAQRKRVLRILCVVEVLLTLAAVGMSVGGAHPDIAIIAGGIGLGVLLTCFPSQTVLAAAKAHREREFDGGLFFSLLAAGLGVVILLVWLGHIIQGRHYDQALACLVLFFFVLAWDEWRRRQVQPTGSRDDRHRSRAL